ncbi:HAMP domain-containing sensor histidine kinase [Cryobacterium sp. SO2]|uniref:sensor histidine kinase n=1 Tax=Cryobacterium sp. SO2 TaxID=1897060 RepID=UPI00223DA47F|nr:HAMP domain-containing sensor histidine kinase [Cryobacterium sp. SO2]WEO75765.1 HAMP domain-containing sensor histidine kinase [Cryobacterium sp. SO2]
MTRERRSRTAGASARANTPDSTSELRRAARRLAVQFTALIVVLLVLVGALAMAIVSAAQQEASDQELQNSAAIDSPEETPTGVYLMVVDDGRLRASRELPAELPDEAALSEVAASGESVETSVTIDGHSYRVLTSVVGPHLTQVAVDQHQREEEQGRLFLALSVSVVLAAVAAWFLAAWMARRAMRPLAQALALQRRFVADASHELRTPLTVLSTRAQMLRRRLPADAAPANAVPADAVPGDVVPTATESVSSIRGQVDEIIQDSRLLTEILEDLLIAADPREVAERTPLDLAGLGDDAVVALRDSAARRGITLERTGSTEPVMVNGAKIALHRLFTALVSNALDHATGAVRVEITTSGANAVVRVRDDGPGFPPDLSGRAFERFASARPGETGQGAPRHYGLGLALVAEVAGRHGGTVAIEPSDGTGAVVVVTLPLHR